MGHSQSITGNASSRRPDTQSGLHWAPVPVCLYILVDTYKYIKNRINLKEWRKISGTITSIHGVVLHNQIHSICPQIPGRICDPLGTSCVQTMFCKLMGWFRVVRGLERCDQRHSERSELFHWLCLEFLWKPLSCKVGTVFWMEITFVS